jgi:hypothetical protein
MGGPINHPAGQRDEHDEAQQGNTSVTPELELQRADSTRFINFHTSESECNVAASSHLLPPPPERLDAIRCWFLA